MSTRLRSLVEHGRLFFILPYPSSVDKRWSRGACCHGRVARETMFVVGQRPDVADILIVITDGKYDDANATWREAMQTRARNISIIAVSTSSVPLSYRCWWRSIMVRMLVSAGEHSLSCARLHASWMGDHFVVMPSAIGQPTWPTQPSIPQGSVNE